MAAFITNFTPRVGALVLLCTSMAMPGAAAPAARVLAANRLVPNRPPPEAEVSRPRRLDLRLPALRELVNESQREFAGGRNGAAGYESRLATLGAEGSHERAMSRAEAAVRRFHREGLPFAKLWQGHTGSLSLGLNQKGKPGLWLVQKTH